MSDPQDAAVTEQELAEMIESVDRYHDDMRRWRARRLVRWSVAAIAVVLLLSALGWATGAAAGAALGGVLDFGATGGPSGVERALFNLQQAGKAATYASLFALAGILLMTVLSRRLPSRSEPEPPEGLRAQEEDGEDQAGDHQEWMPPAPD
jgi:hypothetical protein